MRETAPIADMPSSSFSSRQAPPEEASPADSDRPPQKMESGASLVSPHNTYNDATQPTANAPSSQLLPPPTEAAPCSLPDPFALTEADTFVDDAATEAPTPAPHHRSGIESPRATAVTALSHLATSGSSSFAGQDTDMDPFAAFGPLHAGTPVLIRALSAMPWSDAQSDDDEEDEVPPRRAGTLPEPPQSYHPLGPVARPAPMHRMSSSLHTIHRPIAYSTRRSQSHRMSSSTTTTSSAASHQQHPLPVTISHTLTDSPESRPAELEFPVIDNIAAHGEGKEPSESEQDYQFAALEPVPSVSSSSFLAATEADEADRVGDEIIRGEVRIDDSGEADLPHNDDEGSTDAEPGAEGATPIQTAGGLKRKQELAVMLKEVFHLEDVEEVLGELSCWLLRSVLLNGYMYLTMGHICFYAHMPARSRDKVVKTGPLTKKATRSLRSNKYWTVLRNGVLSWYLSSSDPYFPHGNVDLQYAIECEPVDERTIRLLTNRRSYTFYADTSAGRDEWVKAIRKVIFRTQHEGEAVKIAIPLEAIAEVAKTHTMDFAETLEIRIAAGGTEGLAEGAAESYFFAYFSDIDGALQQIRTVVETFRDQGLDEAAAREAAVYDTTTIRRGPALTAEGGSQDVASAAKVSSPTESGFRISSLLQPFSSSSAGSSSNKPSSRPLPPGAIASMLSAPNAVGMAMHLHSPRSSTSSSIPPSPRSRPVPVGSRPKSALPDASPSPPTEAPVVEPLPLSRSSDSVRTISAPQQQQQQQSASHARYPPTPSPGPPPPGLEDPDAADASSRTFGFIKRPAMKIISSGTSSASNLLLGAVRRPTSQRRKVANSISRRKTEGGPPVVTETVEPAMMEASRLSNTTTSDSDGVRLGFPESEDDDGDYAMMERSETDDKAEREVIEDFHDWFAMDQRETLLEHFGGFLFRVVPVWGKIFISTNYFCFRATHLLYKTKMIVPIRDIAGLQSQKAFRFGHYGLVVVLRGHEELFLEFASAERRDACRHRVEEQLDRLKRLDREAAAQSDEQPSGGDGERSSKTAVGSTVSSAKAFASPVKETLLLGGGLDEPSRSKIEMPSPTGDTETLPPVMFTSANSTFLDFRPTKPLHITCLTIGSRGDVQPYIALCKGLKAEGHQVRIASHGEYKDWIEGHGIEFGYVGGDPAELMRICVENGMFTVSFIKEGLIKFREWIDDLLLTAWAACQGTDVLIESPSAMGGLHIAEGLGIPYFRAFTMPWSRTRAYPHAFAVPESHRGGSYNYMTYTMFDQVFWRAISGQVNRWRKKTIGIGSTNLDKMAQHARPMFYNFSPSVVPPPLDWPEWIRVTGYWFLDDPDDSVHKKWAPPDDLLGFIDRAHEEGKKVVYIGFGSIVVSDPKEMTRIVVEAVLEADVRVILSKGWSDRLNTKPKEDPQDSIKTPEERVREQQEAARVKTAKERDEFPSCIYPISSIPHDWLFPRIDAACHHGGAGTSGASMRAGIPTIIKPFFGDQYFWADRVEVLGIGSSLRKLTKEHLAAALRTATTDKKQIEKARTIGEQIRSEDGVARAIEALYRDLDYARSLIRQPTQDQDVSPSASPISTPSSSPLSSAKPLPSAAASFGSPGSGSATDESWDSCGGGHEPGSADEHEEGEEQLGQAPVPTAGGGDEVERAKTPVAGTSSFTSFPAAQSALGLERAGGPPAPASSMRWGEESRRKRSRAAAAGLVGTVLGGLRLTGGGGGTATKQEPER